MDDSGVESAGFKLFGIVIVADENRHIKSSPSPPPPRLPTACPRCNSNQTKFCYFNNYNVNQPRHFCKACHRYWTAGGALRNVPVGAGRRRSRLPARVGSEAIAEGRESGWKCGAEAEPWMLRREQASVMKMSNAAASPVDLRIRRGN